MRRYTREVFDERNYDVIDEVVVDDLAYHNPTLPGEITSPSDLKEAVELIHAAFPDFEAPIEDLIAEGDRVVTRTREMGTHEAEFAGIPGTGETVDVQGINVYRLEDGKIAEMWIQVDTMGLMDQLDAMEPPGA